MDVKTASKAFMMILGFVVLTTQGCYVDDCPQSSHCKAYYDLGSGCSWCVCSDRLVKEVCPNKRMVCPRNCPPRTVSPGCYSCACMFPGLPFRFMRRPF